MESFLKAALVFVFMFLALGANHSFAKEWQLATISDDIIDSAADKDSLENIESYFSGRNVTINDNILYVDNMSCEVINRSITPLEYWMSERTVSFYRDFFKKDNAIITQEINFISTVHPDSPCQYPFSEFIEMSGDLVFFYNNRVVWYYPKEDQRLVKEKINISKWKGVSESNDAICQHSSNEMDVVYQQGFIISCFYPETDLLSGYNKSRDGYENGDVLRLLKPSIDKGKDESVVIEDDFSFDYKWKSANELEIVIFQPGGTTTLNYLQKKSGTTVKTTLSPD